MATLLEGWSMGTKTNSHVDHLSNVKLIYSER